ncbi:GH25 family lysozyme [Kocuria rhizophila]|uniref:GH25 family lysozyme n=1 Tax=Kocuria rhizophila TaxID=72000 RepID=UPI001D21DE91|nr:GH25 family lysozyme [Kocuria rhizophila]MCC5672851.1 lysozyme [Kocuria rhizophila]
MTSPRKTVLPAAVTAAALVLTTLLPATAADEPHQNLNPSKGDVVSVETKELATVVQDPELPKAPPRTGDKNPGATMGQKFKSMADTTKLSPASEKALEKVEKSVLGGAAPTGATPSKGTSGAKGSAPSPTAAAGIGPAGSMSLAIRAGSWRPAGIAGMDVSGWQPAINWSAEYANGARFAYVKASEGIGYRSEAFNDQYTGSYAVGMNRGAYHFALPSQTTGAAQADFFVNSGGGWSADGRTLPGLLDIEYNPYPTLGDTCYNMSAAQMNGWIKSFSDRYRQRTGRLPAIYTTADWWATCTGNTAQFNNHPLHLASYGVAYPAYMPNGWSRHDLWQFTDNGPFSGDSNVYGGSWAQFQSFAASKYYQPLGGRAGATPPSYAVGASVRGAYNATGGAGRWGKPVHNESAAANGGRYQEFRLNATRSRAYWHPTTGAHMINISGGIGGKFASKGYERGYGYPTIENRSIAGGYYQVFRNAAGGSAKILWSPATGAHAVNERGAIGNLWARRGYEKTSGFPVTDEYRVGHEVQQRFSNGYTYHWNSTNGAVWVTR